MRQQNSPNLNVGRKVAHGRSWCKSKGASAQRVKKHAKILFNFTIRVKYSSAAHKMIIFEFSGGCLVDVYLIIVLQKCYKGFAIQKDYVCLIVITLLKNVHVV